MEQSIGGQALQALISLASGLIIGLIYDVLRVFRRGFKSRVLTAIADTLFWGCAAVALFVLGLWAGEGRQRIFMQVLAALGAALYFLTLSPLVRRVGDILSGITARILSFLLWPVRQAAKILKKIMKKIKKLFHSSLDWYKIERNKRKRTGSAQPEVKEYAIKTHKYSYEDSDSGTAGLRRGVPDGTERQARRGRGRA